MSGPVIKKYYHGYNIVVTTDQYHARPKGQPARKGGKNNRKNSAGNALAQGRPIIGMTTMTAMTSAVLEILRDGPSWDDGDVLLGAELCAISAVRSVGSEAADAAHSCECCVHCSLKMVHVLRRSRRCTDTRVSEAAL